MSKQLETLNEDAESDGSLSVPEVLLDNETTRITFHRIKPGQQSGWHRHEYNYVGVQEFWNIPTK